MHHSICLVSRSSLVICLPGLTCVYSNMQVGQWKFLGFSGEFVTKLHVHQDKKARTVSLYLVFPLPATQSPQALPCTLFHPCSLLDPELIGGFQPRSVAS